MVFAWRRIKTGRAAIDTHNVRSACDMMDFSYLNKLEQREQITHKAGR
jgi:hypothetical protein